MYFAHTHVGSEPLSITHIIVVVVGVSLVVKIIAAASVMLLKKYYKFDLPQLNKPAATKRPKGVK